MKFSVAPESRRAMASALFAIEWMKNRTVMDFRADIYTFESWFCLIKADLIREREKSSCGPISLANLSFSSCGIANTSHRRALILSCAGVSVGWVGVSSFSGRSSRSMSFTVVRCRLVGQFRI